MVWGWFGDDLVWFRDGLGMFWDDLGTDLVDFGGSLSGLDYLEINENQYYLGNGLLATGQINGPSIVWSVDSNRALPGKCNQAAGWAFVQTV